MGLKLLWRVVVVLGLMLGVLNAPAHACACGDEIPKVTWADRIFSPEGLIILIIMLGPVLLALQVAVVIWEDARRGTPPTPFYYKRPGSERDYLSQKSHRDY